MAKVPSGICRVWTREVPVEWETALRDISPVSRVVPWLALRWYPMVRQTYEGAGDWHDAGRWMLYECVPMEILPPSDLQFVLQYGSLEPPRWLPKNKAYGRKVIFDDYQWDMFRAHRVYARQLWIIQGPLGGHATRFEEVERQLLRLKGLPQEPPDLGQLSYAPFDQRVVRQMLNRNRLMLFGNSLDRWRQSADPLTVENEWKEQQREYRIEYLKWLEEQVQPQIEFWTDFSRTMECRNQIPAASREQMDAASQFRDQFIDTGTVPHAPMVAG